MKHKLAKWWCGWFHGGVIERDNMGRINWHCVQCGRWSDHPVPLKQEAAAIRALIPKDEV